MHCRITDRLFSVVCPKDDFAFYSYSADHLHRCIPNYGVDVSNFEDIDAINNTSRILPMTLTRKWRGNGIKGGLRGSCVLIIN